MAEGTQLIRGLEGVVAAETELCDLDGKNGRLACATTSTIRPRKATSQDRLSPSGWASCRTRPSSTAS